MGTAIIGDQPGSQTACMMLDDHTTGSSRFHFPAAICNESKAQQANATKPGQHISQRFPGGKVVRQVDNGDTTNNSLEQYQLAITQDKVPRLTLLLQCQFDLVSGVVRQPEISGKGLL